MDTAFPTLSAFETDPNAILDEVFSAYLLTDNAQSNAFKGEIISLPKRMQMYDNEPEVLCEDIRLDLQKCVSRYFDQCIIDVTYDGIDKTKDKMVTVFIEILAYKNGNVYKLSKSSSAVNGKIVKTIDILNG